jgi:hydrogenase 3 maturation protease
MKKAVVVGIGNTLRGDDGIGVLFLKRMMDEGLFKNCDAELIAWDGPISSIVGKLMNAEKIIVVDTVDMGKRAGEVGMFSKEQVSKISFDTHKASVRVFAEMFEGEFYLVGIQPKNIELGENISKECLDAYEKVVEVVKKILNC